MENNKEVKLVCNVKENNKNEQVHIRLTGFSLLTGKKFLLNRMSFVFSQETETTSFNIDWSKLFPSGTIDDNGVLIEVTTSVNFNFYPTDTYIWSCYIQLPNEIQILPSLSKNYKLVSVKKFFTIWE